MCGRFFLTQSRAELETLFGVTRDRDSVDDASLQPRYNLPPTDFVPGATMDADRQIALDLYRWGFIPSYVTNLSSFKLSTINARTESVARSKTYGAAFRTQRVLVPASGFFEWDRTHPKAKQPYAFVRSDGTPLAFAGIWDHYRHPEGMLIRTCAVLTTAANSDMPIHDRLPLIVERDAWERWLDPTLTDFEELDAMVSIASPGVLRHYPVNRRVNSVEWDDPTLIEPIELHAIQQTLL